MKFEDMNPLQRRLHNAAIVLDAEGDEHGFVGLLREAIAAEEAQGVGPVYLVATGIVHEGWETYTRHDVCPPLCDAEKLFTRPAPPLAGEHAALCYRLKEMAKAMTLFGYAGCADLCIEAAYMLAADAVRADKRVDSIAADRDYWREQAQQVAAPDLRKLIEGMTVSIDVSTGEHDSGNRLFGVVNEVMESSDDKNGLTLLVYEATPNFKQALEGAVPPPPGWDNGLSQDYCKGLGQWLANRPGARQQLREMLVDPTGAVMVEYDIGSESTESAIHQKLIDFGWTPPGADQLEDVRAMVPMTDSEVSTALNGIGSSGLLMRIVRAVEAHHGIK